MASLSAKEQTNTSTRTCYAPQKLDKKHFGVFL